MRRRLYTLVVVVLLAVLAVPSLMRPLPTLAAGAYDTNSYRNLFAERGKTQTEIDNKVNGAYNQLFSTSHADRVYYESGTDKAYIYAADSQDVRSEGMSYGMMIAVQMDDKVKFDKLWNWAYTYMYHKDANYPAGHGLAGQVDPNYGYFSWQVKPDGWVCDHNPAPDGEEYFAMALYFAANRWGNGAGIYNYKSYADQIISSMKNRADRTGPIWQTDNGACNGVRTTRTMTAKNLFDATEKKVRFTPESTNAGWTDPSYHLPSFYKLFALWGPSADATFWNDAANASRTFFGPATHDTTGLSPDYSQFSGAPYDAPWGHNQANFNYDAYRTVANIAMDISWWDDATHGAAERTIAGNLLNFFNSKGATTYGHLWLLDGSALAPTQYDNGAGHAQGLVAMNAVAALAVPSTHAAATNIVNDFWNQPIPTGTYRYYDGMLYMMGLLHASGKFKIWKPATPISTFTPTATATRTNTPVPGAATATPTRTNTPVPSGGGACSPVTATITAPFTYDGSGTFCWKIATVPAYINSWNTGSVTINGTNFSNVYVGTGQLPAKIDGYWYISFSSTVSYAHIEVR